MAFIIYWQLRVFLILIRFRMQFIPGKFLLSLHENRLVTSPVNLGGEVV